jgi:hypothetical protein
LRKEEMKIKAGVTSLGFSDILKAEALGVFLD